MSTDAYSVVIVTAVDCKIAINISNILEKQFKNSHHVNINNMNINKKLFKDFKKIEQISENEENSFYIFIVSPYLNGKQCRSIRRFQRKLDKYPNKLNKLLFCVISMNDNAKTESYKMYETLKTDKKSIDFYNKLLLLINNDNNEYNFNFDDLLLSINNLINKMPKIIINKKKEIESKDKKDKIYKIDSQIEKEYDFTICYGTQTGNAQEICHEIVSIALSKNDKYLINGPLELNKLDLINIDNINNNKLKYKYLIIVVSTTGDGEVPINADIFYRKLKMKCLSFENHENKLLSFINYAILGLGDSNYSQFNAAAKNIDKCLSYLGGNKFYHTGYGDDGIGLEDVVEPWKYGIIDELNRKLKIKIISNNNNSNNNDDIKKKKIPKRSKLNINNIQFQPILSSFIISKCHKSSILPSLSRYELFNKYNKYSSKSYKAYDSNNQFLVELISAKYLTSFESANYSDTIIIHLTLGLPHGYSYDVGDVLCIYPPNPEFMVNKLLSRLKFNGNDIIKITSINEIISTNPLQHIPFKKEITISDIFRFCIDIRSIPKSSLFIKTLSSFCLNEVDKISLLSFSCNSSSNNSLIELFDKYPSCYPSLQCLLYFLSELKPRQYSICSSPNYKPDQIDICFRALKYDINITDNLYDGLCSCFLYSLCCHQANLLKNDKVKLRKYKYGYIDDDNNNNDNIQIAAYFKLSSTFKPPSNPSSSLILIGPGTGVAVFRGFLQHRYQQNKLIKNTINTICDGLWRGIDMQFSDDINDDDDDKNDKNDNKSQCVLFFGCRHPNKDYLYKNDWKQFIENGVLNNLFVAFSRYYDNKIYVQHLLKENSSLISNMILNDNAYIFVCGDASKMAKDVENTFIELIALHSKMSIIESTKYLKNMKNIHRYNVDVWNSTQF